MISKDRQNHFAHLIVDQLWKDDLVDYSDEDQALRIAKRAVEEYIHEIDIVDDLVRKKVLSLKRTVIEGSPEWDTLYKKYFEEEMNRRG